MQAPPPIDPELSFCRSCSKWLFKNEFCKYYKKCKGWLKMKQKADRIVNKIHKNHNKNK